MRTRHPIPRQWLMTDERMGEALWTALEAMPRGAGVVVRHHASAKRSALLARIERVARRRGLVVVGAGGLRASGGVHNARRSGRGLVTRSAHSRRAAIAARRSGADAVFVSPVWPTRSHPGARALGRARLGLMIRGLGIPVIALGGMDARRMRALWALGVYGWAGIDAWIAGRSGAQRPAAADQKRKAVPTYTDWLSRRSSAKRGRRSSSDL